MKKLIRALFSGSEGHYPTVSTPSGAVDPVPFSVSYTPEEVSRTFELGATPLESAVEA